MAASWAPYEGISKGRVTFIINILGALCCICYSKTYINRVKPHWPGELLAHLFIPTLILSLIWLRTCVTNPYSVEYTYFKKSIYLGPQNACDPYLFKMTSASFVFDDLIKESTKCCFIWLNRLYCLLARVCRSYLLVNSSIGMRIKPIH